MMKKPDPIQSRGEKQQHLQNALAPFEDDLIAQLPKPEQIIQEALKRQQQSRQRFKRVLGIAVFALVVGTLYIDPIYQQQTFITTVGEQKSVQLIEGSQLDLNTNTRLKVSYHLLSSRIELQQGEATFHVKHQVWHDVLPWLERRFSVYVDDVTIQDIGTVFNIYKQSDQDVQVTVLRGQVRVWQDKQAAIDLSTGQRLLSRENRTFTLSPFELQQSTTWQQGYLYFNDQPLQHVLDELNRYGDMPVQIKDHTVATLRISGQVDLKDRTQFIYALPSFAPVRIQQKIGNKVLIAPK